MDLGLGISLTSIPIVGSAAVLGPTDPDFANVVLLLHLDGADESTSTTDSSSSNHTITFQGSAAIDTAQSQFGGSSVRLHGQTGVNHDALLAADSADWTFGASEPFTLEGWMRSDTTAVGQVIFSHYNSGGNQKSWWWQRTSGQTLLFGWSLNGSAVGSLTSAATTPTNSWAHVAVTRDASGVIRQFIGGTLDANTTTQAGAFFNSNTSLRVGSFVDGGLETRFFQGWLDDLRITKGVARYTSSFTPPTEPFPNK